MKLAIQDNLLPGKDISEKVRNAEKFGFDGLEVWGRRLSERFQEIKQALESSKIKFSTVCAGYPGDLLGADRQTREAAIEGIKSLLKICSDLGGVGVITVPTFGKPKIPDL